MESKALFFVFCGSGAIIHVVRISCRSRLQTVVILFATCLLEQPFQLRLEPRYIKVPVPGKPKVIVQDVPYDVNMAPEVPGCSVFFEGEESNSHQKQDLRIIWNIRI